MTQRLPLLLLNRSLLAFAVGCLVMMVLIALPLSISADENVVPLVQLQQEQEQLQQQQEQMEQQRQQQLIEEQQREQQLIEEQQREQQLIEEQQREQQLIEEQQREQQLIEEQQREQQLIEEQQREQQLIEEQQREQQLIEEQQREQQLIDEQQREQQLIEEQQREQQLLQEQMEQQQQFLLQQQQQQQQDQMTTSILQRGVSNVLTEFNFDAAVREKDVVFVAFYASWCRFSQMLMPILDGVASHIGLLELLGDRVAIAKVDCEAQKSLAMKYAIAKYPTMKIFKNGKLLRKEYRGERSLAAIVDFLSQTLSKDYSKQIASVQELNAVRSNGDLGYKGKDILGYFPSSEDPMFATFRETAMQLSDDCPFFYTFDYAVGQHLQLPQYGIKFSDNGKPDVIYQGGPDPFEFRAWVTQNCVPLVREITFENAEALTEEQLPFLILFYNPENRAPVQKFADLVSTHFATERANFNFITADGIKFSHPLHHLGKHTDQLPVLAIDSFQHMYGFEDFSQIDNIDAVKQFITDFRSGKLHEDFHKKPQVNHGHAHGPGQGHPVAKRGAVEEKPKEIPESTFKKLLPSKNRYSILRDEL